MRVGLLEIDQLGVTIPGPSGEARVLDDVSLTVDDGEIVGLVGQSGSGKSMTALAILGLLPDRRAHLDGSVRFAGRELLGAAETTLREVRGAEIGMVFQEPGESLHPHLRIGRQVGEAVLAHNRVPRDEVDRRVAALLRSVHLPAPAERVRQYPYELSGGMQQRVMIATALACRPRLLIADEPTTALDVTIQAQIIDLLREGQQTLGSAVLFITHDLALLAGFADRVVVMRAGQIVESGHTGELLAHPRHPYTRALIDAAPRMRPAASGATVRTLRPDLANRPLLEATGLQRRFVAQRASLRRRRVPPAVAVDGVDLDIRAGETLALVGESGSGKSTVARLVLRLLDADGGSIRFRGEDVTSATGRELQRVRGSLQAVLQDPTGSLDPTMTAGEHLAVPLSVHGRIKGPARHLRVAELLDQVGLAPELTSRYPYELSGGQRQRVALARALAAEPRLIVLDEPLSSLDVSTQSQVVTLLQRLQSELEVAFLLIAHDLPIVRRVAHRVAVMYLGRIVESGPTDAVFDAPRHPYTQALLSAVSTLDPDDAPSNRTGLGGEIPSPTAIPSGCRFHTRCPLAFDDCRITAPLSLTFGDCETVECHLHDRGPRLAGRSIEHLVSGPQLGEHKPRSSPEIGATIRRP